MSVGWLARLILAVYFVETGLLLAVAPWTPWWRRNFFADAIPGLPDLMSSIPVRGAVVLTGLVTLSAGVREALALRQLRRDLRSVHGDPQRS